MEAAVADAEIDLIHSLEGVEAFSDAAGFQNDAIPPDPRA
jgi:hypothetical protein